MAIQPQGGCVISSQVKQKRNRVAVGCKPFPTQGSRSGQPWAGGR